MGRNPGSTQGGRGNSYTSEWRTTIEVAALVACLTCIGCVCLGVRQLFRLYGPRRHNRPVKLPRGWRPRTRPSSRQGVELHDSREDEDDSDDDDTDNDDDDEYEFDEGSIDSYEADESHSSAPVTLGRRQSASMRNAAFEDAFDAEAAHNVGGRDISALLGVSSLPAVYKTADGAATVDVPVDGLTSVESLLIQVSRLGSGLVDSDISIDTIRVHGVFREGEPPRILKAKYPLRELSKCTALIVTPAKTKR